MKFCDQCKASIGWFSRKTVELPGGRTVLVCPECADRLRREAVARARRAEPVAEPAVEPAAVPVADGAASDRGDPFGAALDQLRNAGTNPATVDLVRQMLGQAGAAGQGATSARTSTTFSTSSIDVRTPRGQFRGSGVEAEARLVSVLCGRFRAKTGLDAAGDPNARERIAGAAKKAVDALMSGAGSFEVSLPFLSADASGPKHLEETVRLEDLV